MVHLVNPSTLSPSNEILSSSGKLLRGKYKGWDAAQVVINYPKYITYILSTWDMLDDDREVLEILMNHHHGT